MKFTREIAKKINNCGIFGSLIFSRYKLGHELKRLSEKADEIDRLYDEFEEFAFDFDSFIGNIKKCEFKSLFEINEAILKLQELQKNEKGE